MSTPQARGVLSHLQLRLAALWGVRLVIMLGAVAALLALAALATDAIAVLSPWARARAPWVPAAGAALVLALALAGLRRLRARRVARELEMGQPSLGSQLINAVQLAGEAAGSPVTEALRRQAVELGRERARTTRAWPVARRAMAVALTATVLAVGLWGAGLLAFPDVFRAVLPRFLDPHGDHPPYSRVRITAQPGDTEVLYGGQCEIRARTDGPPVEKLALVVTRNGQATRSVMFVAPDRSFFQTVVNIREETEYYVTDGRARTYRHRIRVKLTPRITRLEVKAEFPSYTGRPAAVEQLKDDALAEPMDKRLPRGTRLSFRVRSNRPLASGTLELTPILGGEKTVVTLERTDDSTVAGGFTLAEPVVFTLGVTDTDGIASTAPRHGRVTLLPDRRPRVTVLQPGKHAVATPDVAIPVLVRAEDDYAVTRLIWYRGHNRSAERPHDMALEMTRGPAGVEAKGAFRLGDLGVKPGDVIEYFFEAVDNYPDGPNLATSRMFRVQVISMKEYQELLRRAAAQGNMFEMHRKLGNWLRRLTERAEALAKKARELEAKGGGTPEERAALQKEAQALANDMAEYRKALAKAMKQPPVFDVERLFRMSIREQREALAGVHEQLETIAGKGPLTADALDGIARTMAGLSQRQREKIGEPIEQLIAVARLIAKAQTFVRLAKEQEQVVELARRFQDRRDELTVLEKRELEELGRTERRIRDELLKLLDELPDLVAQLPPGAEYDLLRDSVNGFMAGVLAEGIAEELEEATGKFLDHDGVLGAVHARIALEKMNKFISRCKSNNMLGVAKQCLRFQPNLSEAMGNTLEQLVAAMSSGSAGSGMDGYSMVTNQMALYGPNMERTGEQGGREPATTSAVAGGPGSTANGQPEQELPTPSSPGRVRLQHDARFPLRYRELVGEYFRAIAESQDNP